MNRDQLVQQIKRKAKDDEKKRKDRRFLEAMGFLVAKGFLRTNFVIQPLPNQRLELDEVIWAGREVEPRILEVLPAAVLRLQKHFRVDPQKNQDLLRVVEQLRKRQGQGDAFEGIPFEKLKVWADYPLLDRRVKTAKEKKATKTFRLCPRAIDRLKDLSKKGGCTETEVLEKLILEFDHRFSSAPRRSPPAALTE